MTRIKLCGISRTEDIEAVNRIFPDYIGFVFAGRVKDMFPKKRLQNLSEDWIKGSGQSEYLLMRII